VWKRGEDVSCTKEGEAGDIEEEDVSCIIKNKDDDGIKEEDGGRIKTEDLHSTEKQGHVTREDRGDIKEGDGNSIKKEKGHDFQEGIKESSLSKQSSAHAVTQGVTSAPENICHNAELAKQFEQEPAEVSANQSKETENLVQETDGCRIHSTVPTDTFPVDSGSDPIQGEGYPELQGLKNQRSDAAQGVDIPSEHSSPELLQLEVGHQADTSTSLKKLPFEDEGPDLIEIYFILQIYK
jgi:hypothetical protein